MLLWLSVAFTRVLFLFLLSMLGRNSIGSKNCPKIAQKITLANFLVASVSKNPKNVHFLFTIVTSRGQRDMGTYGIEVTELNFDVNSDLTAKKCDIDHRFGGHFHVF